MKKKYIVEKIFTITTRAEVEAKRIKQAEKKALDQPGTILRITEVETSVREATEEEIEKGWKQV